MNIWKTLRIAGLGAILAGVGLIAGMGSALATAPGSDGNHKVTICHATASQTNPYVVETVDIASSGYLQGGHNNHDGDIIPPYMYQPADGPLWLNCSSLHSLLARLSSGISGARTRRR